MKRQKTKTDYSISIRYKKDNSWSDWVLEGKGKFIDMELIHKQANILIRCFPKASEFEIKFIYNKIEKVWKL
jgi:hypothetical protein